MKTRPRRLARIGIALAIALGLWFLINHYAESWLAAITALVVMALAGAVADRYVPTVIAAVTGDSPLGAVAGDDTGFYSDGWSVVLPGELPHDRRPREGQPHLEARAHLVSLGAYDVGQTHLRLALEGRSPRTVTVTEIRARIHEREPPIAGTLISSLSAGLQEVIPLHFNLDEDSPTVKRDGMPFFRDYALSLSEGEVQVFAVTGETQKSACSWELEIQFRVGQTTHLLPLRRSGHSFRTTAPAVGYTRCFKWAWDEQPSRLIDDSAP